MTTLTKRVTVYLEPELHKALRLKSVETSRSLSELLNDAIRDELAGEGTGTFWRGRGRSSYHSFYQSVAS